jgi:uncharacterized repeat protein (TIGR03803 family)
MKAALLINRVSVEARYLRRLVATRLASWFWLTVGVLHLVGMCASSAATLPVFQLFHTFQEDPRGPAGALVEGADGNFYGPSAGGTWYRGVLYRITPFGAAATVLSFDGTNGASPSALTRGPDGNLYGSAYYGGNGYTGDQWSGKGTLFRLTPEGALTTLYRFNGPDGSQPLDRMILGRDGKLYGTTYVGGAPYDGQFNFGFGTVFRLTPEGVLTTLFSFGQTNGWAPRGVVEGRDGDLYGTTQNGGAHDFGTVYRLTPAGQHTVLVSFDGANGVGPWPLVAGSDGNLYGTTIRGGSGFTGSAYTGRGTVFKVTTAGVLTTLIAFNGINGQAPHAELVEAPDGSFYGTTEQGGAGNIGTVFRVTPDGALSSLLSFDGVNGAYPGYGLCRASDGNLYGVVNGGGNGGGVLYRLVAPVTLTGIELFHQSAGLTWTAFNNGVYRVERATSLPATNWVELNPPVIATDGLAEFTDLSIAGESAFYRIRLLPDP